VAGPDGQGLLVSGRAIRAEHHLHLKDTKKRAKAVARRAPQRGQQGSRRWRRYRRRARAVEARHRRRIRQAQHEAAAVIAWAVRHRIGSLVIGDPRGVLELKAGRRHNRRTRTWRVGRLIADLRDKAERAQIATELVCERGTSSTCPAPGCGRRVPKPAGRRFGCPHCGLSGHRDLVAAANIATKHGGGPIPPARVPVAITHRRAGAHLPGTGSARRDPRRPHRGGTGSVGPPWPAPPRSKRRRDRGGQSLTGNGEDHPSQPPTNRANDG
jgi:transposase